MTATPTPRPLLEGDSTDDPITDVLARVGPASRHPFESKLLAHVAARTSDGFYNGNAGPEPRAVKP